MFTNLLSAAHALLRRFAGDTRGNFAMIFGLTLIPMFALAGSAIDFSNGVRLKAKLQASLDATALATARYASESTRTTTEIETYANNFFSANFTLTEFGAPPTITASADNTSVTLVASASTSTYFIGIVGINELGVGVDTTVTYANRTVDVALVLDNSGSMGSESRLTNVKSAAKKFAEKLFGETTTNHPNLQIGIVPFNHTVNVGSQYAGASWMDTGAVSPIHSENFSAPSNRFTLYSQITRSGSSISWPGCVEVRPQPYDVYDYTVNAADLEPDEAALGTPTDAQYFVPWFAPDEPDATVSSNNVLKKWTKDNNYLSDGISYNSTKDYLPSSSTPTSVHYDRWTERQQRVAKYTGSFSSSSNGPDKDCYIRAITDLENNLNPLETEIDAMVASGRTNIFQGFMWGWRLVSHEEPFTKGRDQTVDTNNLKFIVLLTDGSHVFGSNMNNPNETDYGAYGYAESNRLRIVGTNDASTRAKAMDGRLAKGCEHAKATGIKVFTITYGSDLDVPDWDTTSDAALTKAVMKGCSSGDGYYYHAPDSTQAEAVFDSIAATINSLYLSE